MLGNITSISRTFVLQTISEKKRARVNVMKRLPHFFFKFSHTNFPSILEQNDLQDACFWLYVGQMVDFVKSQTSPIANTISYGTPVL